MNTLRGQGWYPWPEARHLWGITAKVVLGLAVLATPMVASHLGSWDNPDSGQRQEALINSGG